ncbi:uncharacterized protein LOC114526043 isoform X2 [Dendronephthya gigantea]|uniref:uncharacterized protein LOC114526043 isoform X2 n=1 Tax=Dendronephthya gigantea TaxID=151771 RepID=UPI001069CE71|nr:uncharacterized protein LOC114526043 isoform X2 [Dendronephthya gigantea]
MESLRTRINGFTAWVNVRLSPSGIFLHNVLEDLLKGKNMKILLESMTGKPLKKLQSFDGLTQQQKITRVEWMLRELKQNNIILPEVKIDTQMFAMRSSTQVFELLWCLVCHDIWYVWKASFMLQQTGRDLVAEPFSWVPSSPPNDAELEKKKSPRSGYPEPDACILDMINAHLKMTREGRTLTRGALSLDDLTDSRVLCALVNSFVPETFTTEVLLNDRWTVNLALQTANEFFKSPCSFDVSDLAQADIMSVCSYFAFFFMCGYKLRQSQAALKRMDELLLLKLEIKDEIAKIVVKGKDNDRKLELEKVLAENELQIHDLESHFDLSQCSAWMKDITAVQNKVRAIVSKRIRDKFDIIRVPRNMTINDLTVSLVINLNLTSGVGFYELKTKKVISSDRRIIIQNNKSGEFVDDLPCQEEKKSIRAFLGLEETALEEVNPDSYPDYKIFVSSTSRNKILKAGTLFLYQIFPGSTLPCQRLLFKATKTAEMDTVQKLISFFQADNTFINSKEVGSGNTALHMACRQGHFELVHYLLEHGADIDATNNMNCTPFFAAVGSKQREIAELLIEWGANIYKKNNSGKNAFDIISNEGFIAHLLDKDKKMRSFVSQVIGGDVGKFKEIVEAQCGGETFLRSLRSRCIQGSTLLHTATHFGVTSLVKMLLKERVNINLADYKGATALHRTKDAETLKVLLEAGADIDAVDDDGNSPLHVMCYGEEGKDAKLDCIEILLRSNPLLTTRNKKGMLAIHCCALQGRVDVIELLLRFDTKQLLRKELCLENQDAPSPLFLAVANNHMDCGCWFSHNRFSFFDGEADKLLEKIILGELPCNHLLAVTFLLDHNASAGYVGVEGNTPLHHVAGNPDLSDILQLLMDREADVNALNEDGVTPLFLATQNSCIYNASLLIGKGASMKLKNPQGLTAVDFVTDFEEWINSGFFDEETQARFKAYSLKHSRDLVRAITIKVKGKAPTISESNPSNPNSQHSRVQQIQADIAHLSFPRQLAFS